MACTFLYEPKRRTPKTGTSPNSDKIASLHELAPGALNKSPQSKEHSSSHEAPLERPLAPPSEHIATELGLPLEQYSGQTAHFMGLHGEQDCNLFSSFQFNILNESDFIDVHIRQVDAGDRYQGRPPAHFTMIRDIVPDSDMQVRRRSAELIEEYVSGFAESLVRLYFRFVHPVFPILSKRRFITRYISNRNDTSPALRGVIYGLGATWWSSDDKLKAVSPLSQTTLFERAHDSLSRELDSPKLETLQACLLMLHEQPPATGTTESPKIWSLTGRVVAAAQTLGLHIDPLHWNLPVWEKAVRKKLWWATYLSDKW